ncbi:serine hydrolase domain-containing protein [Chondrinema litorale]|uniref:serine hydrolase domain-containing protein n=1 Tax=Chondrinema litorale TaxID=2994555 RepID=UPI002542CF53|nr:serine hydrolase domain-containing protein [Chondrinema litorale]UZR97112.1 serine hydrolase [Chondrinema litorale]
MRLLKSKLSLLLLGMLHLYICTRSFAQQTPEAILKKADSLLNNFNYDAPGTAVFAVKDGEVIINKAYGLANLEHKVPITPNTAFDLASVSKWFTAFVVSLLIEKGDIKPEDDIRKYIPKLPDYGDTVTISHLLHHTSGLKNFITLLPIAGWSFDDRITFDQVLNLVYTQKELEFKPGSQYKYSNTGYLVLAELVQKVTGVSFREWTIKNIFEPLEMENTQFVDNYSVIIPNRASSYYDNSSGMEFQVSPNNYAVPGPSSLYSTANDLIKWLKFIDHHPDTLNTVFERIFTPGKLNDGTEISHGYSVLIRNFRNTKRISHQGYWFSFTSLLVYLPEYHLSIGVLNNYAIGNYKVAHEIASYYIPAIQKKNPIAQEDTVEAVLPEALEDYVGTYKINSANYVAIMQKGNELWMQQTSDYPLLMTAIGNDKFIVKDNRDQLMTFHRNELNQVTHITVNGKECPLMEKNHYDPDNLQEYTGDYRGEDIKTIYSIVYEDDTLKLGHIRMGKLSLQNIWDDDFQILGGNRWFASTLEFIRDDCGEITGFNLSEHSFLKVNKD